ncbi:DNA-processing protein DprA [Mesorhizobium atlanticum]|uniref:DNA-processing protein DprA n=1 Tax=Mesorhizobium atlanticum TaxID=2233532 RepID=A0A330GGY4_9HYPH|nr:DNA-processing protein DprA [Mesorhizobium atlanticum]RAZ71743.1 DNA-processing protein DprA [Mesorhizobium atlanticum]
MHLARKEEVGPAASPISPRLELGAYEALWLQKGATFKTIAEKFSKDPSALPSDFVSPSEANECARQVLAETVRKGVTRFGVRIHHAGDYPQKLRDAKHPIELLYFQGIWELTETRCIAIVGAREATDEGKQRAKQLARDLTARKRADRKDDFTIVSGLAAGIDRVAHETAIANGGRTIAVIGTPLGSYYPKENRDLQDRIAKEFLLISQVPFLRYAAQAVPQNRLFFPERNVTMSALTEATIIVEASDTSGTLTQARAALYQKRKLFILDSCFRKDLKWPHTFEAQGAVRVRSMDDIWAHLD